MIQLKPDLNWISFPRVAYIKIEHFTSIFVVLTWWLNSPLELLFKYVEFILTLPIRYLYYNPLSTGAVMLTKRDQQIHPRLKAVPNPVPLQLSSWRLRLSINLDAK